MDVSERARVICGLPAVQVRTPLAMSWHGSTERDRRRPDSKLTPVVEGDEGNKGAWVRRLHNVTQVLLSRSSYQSPNIEMRLAKIYVVV